MSKGGLEILVGGALGLGLGLWTKASALVTGLYTLTGAYIANLLLQQYNKPKYAYK